MPALVEPSVETVPENSIIPSKNGLFQRGGPGGPGRPKGVKNAEKAYLRAAPKLAKAYIVAGVRDRNPSILVDARKWIMPTDEDSGRREDQRIFLFIGDGRTPMPADLPQPVVSEAIPECAPTKPIDVTVPASVETP